MTIQFMSSVLFVRDIAASRAFYEGLLGQQVMMDHGLNVGFKGGFAIWQAAHAEGVIFGQPQEHAAQLGSGNLELYFETDQMDELWQRMMAAGIAVVHPVREQPWGQRVCRVYDPDGHIVELGEPIPLVVLRLMNEGMDISAVAQRLAMPEAVIQQIVEMFAKQNA